MNLLFFLNSDIAVIVFDIIYVEFMTFLIACRMIFLNAAFDILNIHFIMLIAVII